MAYQPIDSYALIGDMRSAALVNLNGSIDWLCMPRFDSPSVFAALIDDQKGGAFRIAPAEPEKATCKQYYWPNTNVLVTRFLLEDAAVELCDFMPVGPDGQNDPDHRQVIRRVTAVRGRPTLTMRCRPAFDYARQSHETEPYEGGVAFRSADFGVSLAASVPLEVADGTASATFTLEPGGIATFVLCELKPGEDAGALALGADVEAAFQETVGFWRTWLAKSTYRGRWREMVDRSALALKLMTYEPTGAIVAAPTCSLPEGVGGERNWDYRYTWLRDSAFTVFALARLGFTEEVTAFAKFLRQCADHGEERLQIMYGIDGRRDLTEETLDHLDGYMGSKPVRIGNGAYDQLQLDIYGEVLDALSLFNRDVRPIGYDAWSAIRRLSHFVCENWQRPDEGVWETRGGQQHFLYSKLMCWVALDRAVRIGHDRSLPVEPRWVEVRDTIYNEIMEKGWDDERGFFVQHYGSSTLDASNLMMIITSFLSPGEPRAGRLLDAVMKSPEEGGLLSNSLVYRYNVGEMDDGLQGNEGTFNLCTFWLVNALARAGEYNAEYLEEAQLIFERMLGFANHVGLYAEETSAGGEGLGNFPQAFTHLGLITAAINLNRVLES